MIKQIGLPLCGRPILLITRMITDRIGLHSVLLPLLSEHLYEKKADPFALPLPELTALAHCLKQRMFMLL